MSDKKDKKLKNDFDIQSTTYKLFGIFAFSITKRLVIDEDALYKRMEKRFEKNMTKAIDKVMGTN